MNKAHKFIEGNRIIETYMQVKPPCIFKGCAYIVMAFINTD